MTQNERLDFLINHLISEDNRYCNIVIPKNSEEKFNLFRSLVNVREPKQISSEFIKLQDDYLQERLTEINITDAYDLQAISNKLYLWQGDITTLKCGAIVNAANSAMLGCFVPCHKCIDNAIHTFSGVQLRLECNRIMKLKSQGTDWCCEDNKNHTTCLVITFFIRSVLLYTDILPINTANFWQVVIVLVLSWLNLTV